MPHEKPEDDELFAEAVATEEGRAVRRRTIDPGSLAFRGSFVVVVIGAVWGIAIAFSAFKSGADNTRKDVDDLRREVGVLRSKVLLVKESDLWADSLRIQNAGKITVPKPSDFKVEP